MHLTKDEKILWEPLWVDILDILSPAVLQTDKSNTK